MTPPSDSQRIGPRAFWISEVEDSEPAPVAADSAEVRYERLDAHTVRIVASTSPGFIVVLDGYHPGWKAEDRSGPVPLGRAYGRYRVLPTPGGDQSFTLRFRPGWPRGAFALMLVGLLGLGILARR